MADDNGIDDVRASILRTWLVSWLTRWWSSIRFSRSNLISRSSRPAIASASMTMFAVLRQSRPCVHTSRIGGCSALGARRGGYRPLPATPATVAAFLTLLAERGFSPQELRRTKRGTMLPRKEPVPLGRATIGRRLAAIVFAHRAADVEPPTSQPDAARLERAMRGIRKDKRGDLPGKKRPADGDVLRDMVRAIVGDDLRSYRDRALLAIGMAGAFRRSELVAFTVGHVSQDGRGLLVRIAASKTESGGKGPHCCDP